MEAMVITRKITYVGVLIGIIGFAFSIDIAITAFHRSTEPLTLVFSPEPPGFVRQDWRLNKYNDDDSDEY